MFSTTYLFLSPFSSSRDDVVMFVFIHHAQHTHGRVISATKSLQQFVVLCTELLPHLTCGFDQLVLHQGGIVIVGLDVSLAVGRQAHQAGLLGLLPPGCAEVTQDLPGLGLGPGLAPSGGGDEISPGRCFCPNPECWGATFVRTEVTKY